LQFLVFALLTLKARVADHKDKERGATAVEYGLLVSLIAVAIILVVTALGGQLQTVFCNVTTAIGGTCP
jgi:pilus assembly protein Flp/PilA